MRFTFLLYNLVTVKLLLNIMKEYLLKQPKATCVLFSIACKINLGLVKNNGNPGGTGGGGGCFGLGNPGGRGGYSDSGNPGGWGGGVKKTLPSVGEGGVDFFWNNPMSHTQINKCFVIAVV